jgi:hypothetical protein
MEGEEREWGGLKFQEGKKRGFFDELREFAGWI